MKTIAFLNNKGGVGKTASVSNLAHIFVTQHNKKVLLVDMDPQGNTSNLYSDIDFFSIFQGILKQTLEKKEYLIDDLLLNTDLDPHQCIKKTAYNNLDLIPSFQTLAETEELLKADVRTPQQFKLKQQLNKLDSEYDYCLIDCSPSVSILNINALVASSEVYMPTRCDGGSLVGIAMTINLIRTVQSYNLNLKAAGCFFTQWQGRKNVSQTVYKLLESIPEVKLLPITIGISKYLEENTLQQLPLLEVDTGKNKSSATKGYLRLAEYILYGKDT